MEPTRARRRVWLPLAGTPLLLAAFAIALQTQLSVTRRLDGATAAAWFAVAALVFLVGLALTRRSGVLEWGNLPLRAPDAAAAYSATAPSSGAALSAAGIRLRPALAALGLGAVTFALSGGNRFTALNVATWVLSVACAFAACWEGRPIALSRVWLAALTRRGVSVRVPWHAVALAAILALGAFFLFYRIYDVPREMTSDHAEKLYDVRDVLDGQHRIFFPRNTGREAFQFYWIALMTPLTGVSYLTMKLGTALIAFGALPFTYLLARTFFGTQQALLTTLVLSCTRWLWQVARVGLRFPFPPLFGAATFHFLMRGIRDRRRNDFLLCGLALGAAQHTYTALRLAPLAVLGCVAVAAADDVWRRRSSERAIRLAINTGLLALVALLVFMPLARYAVDEPQTFLFRGMSRVASDSTDRPPRDLLGVFLVNVKNALLMFNWRGDVVWVNTIPGERMLDPVSGALFLLGCVYGVYRLVRFRELPFLYLF
ncbi:MAG TPA: glycosyltransferase family 39 protein, partial [Chloroflexota bacterium]|nr:glycosyltransferase family 39 protein [Chloroflexota bacterium]